MPADPNCVRCQGTGWREVQKGELTAVERCDCSRSTPPEELARDSRQLRNRLSAL